MTGGHERVRRRRIRAVRPSDFRCPRASTRPYIDGYFRPDDPLCGATSVYGLDPKIRTRLNAIYAVAMLLWAAR